MWTVMFGDNNFCESLFQCAQYFIFLDFVAIISEFYYSQVLFYVIFQMFFIIKSFISLYRLQVLFYQKI